MTTEGIERKQAKFMKVEKKNQVAKKKERKKNEGLISRKRKTERKTKDGFAYLDDEDGYDMSWKKHFFLFGFFLKNVR